MLAILLAVCLAASPTPAPTAHELHVAHVAHVAHVKHCKPIRFTPHCNPLTGRCAL